MAVVFELFEDERGAYRYNIRSGSGEIIATTGGYESPTKAREFIEADRQSAEAELVPPAALR